MNRQRERLPELAGQWGQRKSGLFVPFGALSQSKANEIGDFCSTYADVDEMLEFMQGAGFSILQDLPMSPLDDFNSPYSPVTSFAVNPFRIDLGRVANDGDLGLSDIKSYEKELEQIGDQKTHEAINKRKELKTELLKMAYGNFSNNATGARKAEFDAWKKEQAYWLESYATYEILKEMPGNRGKVWQEWGYGKDYSKDLVDEFRSTKEFQATCYVQWIAEKQTLDYVKKARTQFGVYPWGDIPLYTGACDVWANREIFVLDNEGRQIDQGGVPPGGTSVDGQAWGSARYKVTKKCAEWWLRRIERMTYLNGGDGSQTRIDHFIGMIDPWRVELGAKTGRAGERRVGIGRLLLPMMRERYGSQMPFYPEDLGECTEATDWYLDEYRLRRMGLAVRWLRKDMSTEDYLTSSNNPNNYTERNVALSSNHDYPSLVKYIQEMQVKKPEDYQKYLNVLTNAGHNVELGVSASQLAELEVERVIRSKATIAIIAVWDVLGLALQYNTPSEADPLKNWEWRLTEENMSRLRSRMTELSMLNVSRERLALAA